MSSVFRFQFGGPCFAGEKWRVGVDMGCYANVGTPTLGEIATMISSYRALFNTHVWSVLKAYNRSGVNLDYGRVQVYSNGVSTGNGEQTFATVLGTATGAILPGSAAIVATKRTDVSTRDHRGRMYLPITGAVLETSSGQLPDADCTAIANAVAAFYTAVDNTSITVAGVAYDVFGNVTGNPPDFAASKVLTSIRVDSRVDRQVRRQIDAPSQFAATSAITV